MPRYIQKEDGFSFLLEDGTGVLLLEEDWAQEPGTQATSWTGQQGLGGQSWAPQPGSGGQSWTKEDGD